MPQSLLPLRALLPAAERVHIVDRPRFLGLGEFGPRNILYHEGRKYRMVRCILPTGGVEGRLKKAKFCFTCGYYHDEPHASVDICDHCKTPLTGDMSEFSPFLFEMPTVKGMRVERITCDEEERTREGYELELHYRFATAADGRPIQETAAVSPSGGKEMLGLTYGPQASLWRVNRRWRRSEQKGFSIDAKTGFWTRRPGDNDREGDIDAARLKTGVLPFVRDTRNILLVRPTLDDMAKDDVEAFLASLGYALQRGSQLLFQIEEQEIAVTRIGKRDEQRILFWESAEGGSGVWSRLMDEQTSVSQVATEAMKLCHFDPETGEDIAEKDRCSRACYRCLLSYANQPDHRLLNRFLIRDFLFRLRQAVTTRQAMGRSYEEQYQWLKDRVDPNSSLEPKFLEILFTSRRRLPDRTQFRPEPEVYAEADFYYDRDGLKGVAIFLDGSHHDEPQQQQNDERERKKLEDLGYRVIIIRYDGSLTDQIANNADVFGPGLQAAGL